MFHLSVFVHVERVGPLFGLNQLLFHLGLTHVGVGLPFRGGIGQTCCLGFDKVHRGQIVIATGVVHGDRTGLVIGGRIVAIERFGNNFGI